MIKIINVQDYKYNLCLLCGCIMIWGMLSTNYNMIVIEHLNPTICIIMSDSVHKNALKIIIYISRKAH